MLRCDTFQASAKNKSADQTVWMRRLVCALLCQGPIFISYPESHLDNTVVLSHLVKASPERDRFSIPSLQGKLQREKKKVSRDGPS